MGISDKDRKRLWAHSGNRCALCKARLVVEPTEEDPEAVVGDEAHISARSPGGARYGTCAPELVDTYDNHILLCRTDHKKVDDQPGHYTVELLLELKRDHHAWVDGRLDDASDVVIEHNDGEPVLVWLRTGAEVWNVIANSHSYYLADLDEHDATEEELRLSAAFLQLAYDWAEISSDLASEGPVAIRRAKDSLGEELKTLTSHDLLVFGGRQQGRIKGGDRPPGPWNDVYVSVVRSSDPTITTGTSSDHEAPGRSGPE